MIAGMGHERASASETVSLISEARLCRGVLTLRDLIIFVQNLEQDCKIHSVLIRAIPTNPYNRERTGIYV